MDFPRAPFSLPVARAKSAAEALECPRAAGAAGFAMVLQTCDIIAFVGTTRPEMARAFYCDVLGLGFQEENPFALVVKAANAVVRIQKVNAFAPLPFTALGWSVRDVREAAQQLADKGVRFERFGGMSQDDLGVWLSPSGARVCWFKDPDGNILSLTQFT
jgi:catechol 2,3-dioxygenase-like lactoylglutathione lyase family enzyme